MRGFFRTRYRIVRDRWAGYEVQWRYWWMPFYVQGAINTHSSLAGARLYLERIKRTALHHE
jgi:hypothetical protein